MYGWRGRIGLVIPSSNTTMESEFWRFVPEGASVHTARMRLVEVTKESLERMAEYAASAAEDLSTASVDIIVYGCTTGAMVGGMEWERRLVRSIEERTGVRTISTAEAVVEALRALNARRLVVATPYIDELNKMEEDFLRSCGFDVLKIKGLGLRYNVEIGRQPPWTSYKLAKEVFHRDADALFISCTNFRTFEILELLERDVGVPVVSSNSASLWLALRRIGVKDVIRGLGKLLTT